MTKKDASEACTRMADSHAAREADENGRNHSRVHKAVFDHAFEFIPEGADWTVVNRNDEAPKLVAVGGDKLYVLTVAGGLSAEVGALSTSIKAVTINPATTTVECEAKFGGIRTNAEPMNRETVWTFSFNGGGTTLVMETTYDPNRDGRSGDADTVARRIARAAGWGLVTSTVDYAIEAA